MPSFNNINKAISYRVIKEQNLNSSFSSFEVHKTEYILNKTD
jgi:hypothetical protein